MSDETLMTLQEAADFLRFSTDTVRRKAKAGILTGIAFGGKKRTIWRFRKADLIEHLTEKGPAA